MVNTNLKLSLCRTCLAAILQSNAYNIFNTLDLANKLKLCSGLAVETSDEYPENVCLKCYEQIILFYEFQKMCCKSLHTFHEILKTKEALREECRINNIQSENQVEDPLNDKRLMPDPFTEKSKNLNELLKNKKRDRSPKNILEYQLAKRTRSNKRITRKVKYNTADGNFSKNVMKDELKEYLQFNKETELCLENENSFDDKKIINQKVDKNSITKKANGSDFIKERKYNILEEKKRKSFTEAESSYKCACCSKKFKSPLRLKAHKRGHEELPPYVCIFKGCERSFDGWYFYNKHQKEHNLTQEASFKCDVDNCKRIYKNKSNLNIHKRKFHNLGPQLKPHMCEICGKVFKSSAVLNDHHYIHIDKTQLPYACEEVGCTKRFSNKEKLKIHKMRHAGIKNFSCPYCGMRKTTRNELKIHINYHTLERTYPCRFCPKVCNSAGNLKMHVKNIHERAKDFACSYCGRTFAKADTKKYHEMTHTGEKPHECKECGRRFLQPAALRTHRKIHLRQKMKLSENRKSETVIVREEKRGVVENAGEVDLLLEPIAAD